MRQITRTIVVAFIFSLDKHILMGRKDPSKGHVYPDCWHYPGGGIEEAETLEEAVIREVMEEVGIDIRNQHIIPIQLKNSGSSEKTLANGEKVMCNMDFNYFEIRLDKNAGEVKTKLSDDLAEVKWFSEEEFPNVKQIPGGREFLQELGYITKD